MAMTLCSCLDREARGTFPIEESLAGKLYFRMCIPVSKWVVQHVITFMTTIDRPVVCGIYPSCIWWIPLSSWDAPSSANLECKTMVVFCRCPPNQPITSECYVHLQRLTQLGRVSKIGLTCCIFLCIYTNYSFIYIYIYMIIYRHTHTCNHGSWNHLMFQPLVIGTWWQATGFAPVEHSSLETSLHTLRLQEVMARIEMEDCPERNRGAQNLIS